MKRISYIILTALLAASCYFDDMHLQQPEELGTDMDEYIVEAEGGEVGVIVYANMPGTGRLEAETGWARIADPDFAGDDTLKVTVDANTGRQRMFRMVMETAARLDTVSIKQKGAFEEYFELSESEVIIVNGQGSASVPVNTNVDSTLLSYKVLYLGSEDASWIKSLTLAQGRLTISIEDNPDKTKFRRALVEVTYDDGWGETVSHSLDVTSAYHSGSFEELRGMASEEPALMTDDFMLEGYVVGDKSSSNIGENIMTSPAEIDYTGSEKTSCIESLDGEYGFLLEFETGDHNILKNNTLTRINVKGATLVKLTDPERYVIRGLKASNVMSSDSVDVSLIPQKSRKISELTDKDIYTRVTLTDCEFPVRKGSLTPFNEGYASNWDAHNVSKYPSLIRDSEGSSLYMLTNTTCGYRRDGSRIGYGSGNVTGIIVHEDYVPFGGVGRYQLRHTSRKDLGFKESFSDGFSEMICEWRWYEVGENNTLKATYGEGTLSHTSGTAPSNATDYSYLGPCVEGNTANVNGFGIILDGGISYGSDFTGSVEKGVLSDGALKLAWRHNAWGKDEGYHGWVVEFSTSGITATTCLSMQFCVMNQTGEGGVPNEWKVEWADSDTDAAQWKTIAEYDVPDVVKWDSPQFWKSAGFKPVDVTLPNEMLGKDKVYIRLTPRSSKCSPVAQGYLQGLFTSATPGQNAMNYLAIRYNK